MPPQAMDCLGLALDWENDADVRARLREKGQLLEIPAGELICKPTRHNANMNAVVLAPVLRRLNQSGLVLPHISDLKLEVGSLFQKTGLTTAGDKQVYKVSMEIKQLASFIKRRLNRREVTKEQCLKYRFKNISLVFITCPRMTIYEIFGVV